MLDTLAYDTQPKLLFVPHMPGSCWLNVYGRSKPIQAHAEALVAIVSSALVDSTTTIIRYEPFYFALVAYRATLVL